MNALYYKYTYTYTTKKEILIRNYIYKLIYNSILLLFFIINMLLYNNRYLWKQLIVVINLKSYYIVDIFFPYILNLNRSKITPALKTNQHFEIPM